MAMYIKLSAEATKIKIPVYYPSNVKYITIKFSSIQSRKIKLFLFCWMGFELWRK